MALLALCSAKESGFETSIAASEDDLAKASCCRKKTRWRWSAFASSKVSPSKNFLSKMS